MSISAKERYDQLKRSIAGGGGGGFLTSAIFGQTNTWTSTQIFSIIQLGIYQIMATGTGLAVYCNSIKYFEINATTGDLTIRGSFIDNNMNGALT